MVSEAQVGREGMLEWSMWFPRPKWMWVKGEDWEGRQAPCRWHKNDFRRPTRRHWVEALSKRSAMSHVGSGASVATFEIDGQAQPQLNRPGQGGGAGNLSAAARKRLQGLARGSGLAHLLSSESLAEPGVGEGVHGAGGGGGGRRKRKELLRFPAHEVQVT